METLEINNFSGGVTDYPLQGAPNRAAKLDNFLITPDNKLVVRDGYRFPNLFEAVPFEGAPLIDKYLTIENEDKLLVLANGSAVLKDKYLTTNWVPVTGLVPKGGQISMGEYADTAYMTSDSDTIPRKLYQDETGAYVTRRVGLPKTYIKNPMTESSLLAQCLLLANDLRENFIDHMEDAHYSLPVSTASTVYTAQKSNIGKLHQSRDRKSLSYFQSETAGIEPNQTDFAAAPAATNYTTLFNLTRALLYAFRSHVADASIDTPNEKPYATNTAVGLFGVKQCWYHWILRPKKAVASTAVINPDAPVGPIEESNYYDLFVGKTENQVTIVDIAKALNDLREKYHNHRMGVHIHDFFNLPVNMDKYATSVGEIEDIYSEFVDGENVLMAEIPPKVTPDYTDLINFINNINHIYKKHIGVDWSFSTAPVLTTGFQPVYHIQVANSYNNILSPLNDDFIVNLPNATDIESAKLLFYHLRAQYIAHDFDARPSAALGQVPISAIFGSTDQKILFAKLTGDFQSASTSVLDIKNASAVAKPLNTGAWLWTGLAIPPIADSNTKTFAVPNNYISYVARATGTNAIDRPNTGAVTVDTPFHASMSKYHAYSFATALSSGESSSVTASTSNLIQSDATKMPSSITELATMASELFFAMASHILDPSIHVSWTNTGTIEVNSFSTGVSKYFLDTMIQSFLPNAPFFVPEAGTQNYAFYFSDRYKVDRFQQTDRLTVGAPVYVGPVDVLKSYKTGQVIESQNPLIYDNAIYGTTRPTTITNLPELEGYDTDIYLNLYRTSLNGSVYFELEEADNGITSYLDYSVDDQSTQGRDSLVNRQQIYTTGGVVGFDQIEGAKYIHIVNNKAYYAGIYEDGKLIKNRLLQSINGAPDAVPASFFDDFDDEIVGLSSARSNLIVFCKNSIYREAGEFGETGQGYMTHEKISDVVGALNQSSIVQTEIGVFFAGTDGFYYTDGYQIIKLSLEIDITYKTFTKTEAQRKAIQGSYDSFGRRVWWSVKTAEGDVGNKKFWVLHLNDGVKPSAAFTPVFGDQIMHTTHIFWNGSHNLGVAFLYPESAYRFGYFMHSKPWFKSDDILIYSGDYTEAIKFDYLSCALDAGGIANTKYATKMHVIGDNAGSSSVEPYVVRDMNSDNIGIRAMAPIKYQDNFEWGAPSFVWGVSDLVWNPKGKMDDWRRFPRTTLRSDVFQIGFRNSNSEVYKSDDSYFPEDNYVEINNFTDVQLFSDVVGAISWPSDLFGMKIYFNTDDYETGYTITSQSGFILNIAEQFPVQTVSGLKFIIKGEKKNHRPKINAYVAHFAKIGESGKTYVKGGNRE